MKYLTEVLILNFDFKKNKVVSGTTPFFVIGPFFTPHSICLNVGFLWGTFALSNIILSTLKLYPSFLKKVFVFQRTCFKVKELNMFKISSDCQIKTSGLLNGWLFQKSLEPCLKEPQVFLLGLK